MSLHRFFLSKQVLSHETEAVFDLDLDPDDAKHARVLRFKPGEHIAVIDASSDYFECEVVSAGDGLSVRISRHEHASEPAWTVALFQGIGKGDKMDDVIRHATEIGVSAFVPLMCERGVVKLDEKKSKSRMARWGSIAKSAAMQSGQPRIPTIAEPCTSKQAVMLLSEYDCVLVCWEEEHVHALHDCLSRARAKHGGPTFSVAIIIGSEGGLTDREVDLFTQSGDDVYSVTLGPSILRTETAGLVAPALAIYELGGLQ